ncbi:hypothetical protein THRCLA_22743 [Thraustotheca clavata]|uniref:Uncharacterized protein n=1 Tax=Thraustotheca clavata TaxID=74557 RepID=A0A1V9YTR7_9STRA|nr:hypothetical protein THRCLA_22743 [Thraustotheca clavata]
MIAPFGLKAAENSLRTTKRKYIIQIAGCFYLCTTSLLGLYFLQIAQPSFINDFWWHNVTVGGSVSFLADVYHHQLQLNQTYTVELTAPEFILEKEYAGPTYIDMSLSLSRQVLLSNISFDQVIRAIRATTFEWNIRMFTQYCWVDWNQTYQLSITSDRQNRCDRNYYDNAAMYWEPLLRNSNLKDISTGAYQTSIRTTIFNTIESTTQGREWFASLWTPWLNVSSEMVVWKRHGLTRWQTELTNYYEQGLEQTIVIENALGIRQKVTIHRTGQYFRGLSLWTLIYAYGGIWNDFVECQAERCSLIRGANPYSDQIKLKWEVIYISIPVDKPLPALIDAHMGQFGSIDIFLGQKPSTLEQYYLAYQRYLLVPILSSTLLNTYMNIPSITMDIAPKRWRGINMTYYTGNPMCISSTPQSFVQSQFNFYDACTLQTQSQITLTRSNMIFSLTTLAVILGFDALEIESYCSHSLTPVDQTLCSMTLHNIVDILKSFNTTFYDSQELSKAMQSLNLTMIQFASKSGIPIFLTQPVIDQYDSWSFHGWVMVYDWLQGNREVFKFESDKGTFPLITEYTKPTLFPANSLELPQQACTYVWIILVYSSTLLTIIAMVVLIAATLDLTKVDGANLFQFHRVASMVWVGRPFLALRGVAALVLLSTSPIDFYSHCGMSKFVFAPRNVIETMVVASEASWITYVIVDLLLPLTKDIAIIYAPISAALAWVVIVVWESNSPFIATATVDQSCSILLVGLSATCSGGVVQIGSMQRLIGLAAVNFTSVGITLAITWLLHKGNNFSAHIKVRDMMSASALTFFIGDDNHHYKNATTNIMAGIIPFGNSLFHMSLWQLVNLCPLAPTLSNLCIPEISDLLKWQFGVWEIGGIIYVIFSVIGSYTFIYVSDTAMTNDFWWDSFNSSGHETFLTTLFSTQLQVLGADSSLDLTKFEHADNSNLYNTTSTTFSYPVLYSTMIQDEINTLFNVVQGLRQMNGCQIPWIATYFCYVDFNRTWEMAISTSIQQRCLSRDIYNGAVYLEAFLRNVNWFELNTCWEDSIEIAVLSYLRTSVQGIQWIQAVSNNTLSIISEVSYWNQQGISNFTTQWQNYKALGIIESFSIQNAFGLSYPITLKYSNTSMHTNMQTSFKMQWPFASQLWALSFNYSTVSGASLVRQSPQYAFANTTMFRVLAENQTIVLPLDVGLAIVQNALGPFGDITMRRVAYPSILMTWHKTLQLLLYSSLPKGNDSTIASFRSIGNSAVFITSPKAWKEKEHVGGDITCPTQTALVGLAIFYSIQGVCVGHKLNFVVPNALMGAQVLLAVGANYDINASCNACLLGTKQSCLSFLQKCRNFITKQFTSDEWNTVAQLSNATREYFQYQSPIVLTQYLRDQNSTYLMPANIFDPLDVSYHVHGWFYLLEWLNGIREVVQFSGVNGSMAVISGRNGLIVGPANRLEIPVNVAIFFRGVLIYVSSVLLLVATFGCGYIIVSKCCIEGINMFSLNRVIGLVWVGRPLIFLRGITASCLLSTAKLEMQQSNGFFYLTEQPKSWITAIMASGEVTWLVYLLNDCFSVVTRQHTPLYADYSSMSVWLAVAIWSLVSPVHHTASINRQCTIVAVDNEVVCHSGEIAIGDFSRFRGLVCLSCGLSLLTYCIQRFRYSLVQQAAHSSYFLHATALYHYSQDKWIYSGAYHLDRASAVFNGLITWYWNNDTIVVLDIKTWRVFSIPRTQSTNINPQHIRFAIPLE